MAEKKSSRRTRNWCTIVYPDSAPENWIETLGDLHIPCLISPLHDKDIEPNEKNEPKKPHYHVLFAFEGPKTEEQIQVFSDALSGVAVKPVSSLRAYARYLTHADSPHKAQYKPEDVIALGGLDYFSIISSVADKYAAIGDMIDYCTKNQIYSYAQLLLYCKDERQDWFRVLCDNGTYVLKEFLKSSHWTDKTDID